MSTRDPRTQIHSGMHLINPYCEDKKRREQDMEKVFNVFNSGFTQALTVSEIISLRFFFYIFCDAVKIKTDDMISFQLTCRV